MPLGCLSEAYAIRDALRLRLRLTPYLYSLMREAHETHSPILLPTFVAFEDDPAAFDDADALMAGSWLMAAPVTREGAREVEVYLPHGPEGWRDFWTGDHFASGQLAKVDAPLERLPLFVAAGAVIATTDSRGDYSRLHDESSRALLAFPGAGDGQSSATLYEDDGVTVAGEAARVTVRLVWEPSRIHMTLGRGRLPFALRPHSRRTPKRRKAANRAAPLREGHALPLKLASAQKRHDRLLMALS